MMYADSNTAITPLETIFQFVDREIQTAVDHDGNLWACAKDVFEALEIGWRGAHSVKNMPKEWVQVLQLRTSKGVKDTYFLGEPNLYRLIFRSNKPEAERFVVWLCVEVLPSIRRRGFYGRLDIKDQITLRKLWLQIGIQLDRCTNPFVAKALLEEFQALSREIGAKIGDINTFRVTSDVQPDLGGF